jgi:CTD small phosphatase-like protein 2
MTTILEWPPDQNTVGRRLDEGENAMDEVYVNMPNLTEDVPDLSTLPTSVRNAFQFVADRILPYDLPPPAPVEAFLPVLSDRRLTLVLDLDETLAHCRPEPLPSRRPDLIVHFEDTQSRGNVYLRPYVSFFLRISARLFDVVVFTASSEAYADQVLDYLDPEKWISHRLYRRHCTEIAGGFLKDLRLLGRPMDQVVLVDNSPMSMALNPDHGILVSSWNGDQADDRELVDLLLLLQQCMQCASVPAFLAMRYGLRDFLNCIPPTQC